MRGCKHEEIYTKILDAVSNHLDDSDLGFLFVF